MDEENAAFLRLWETQRAQVVLLQDKTTQSNHNVGEVLPVAETDLGKDAFLGMLLALQDVKHFQRSPLAGKRHKCELGQERSLMDVDATCVPAVGKLSFGRDWGVWDSHSEIRGRKGG